MSTKTAVLADTGHLTHEHMFLAASHDDNARRTLWVVVLTALMMVAEIVAGYTTGSMALLADGFHMATHAGALGVAAAAYAYAKRNAHNGDFSFGTGKVGVRIPRSSRAPFRFDGARASELIARSVPRIVRAVFRADRAQFEMWRT